MIDYIVPVILLITSVLALRKKENSYDLLLNGAADGLKLLVSIVPSLILLLVAVTMLRASGAVELISSFLAPAFSFFGIPRKPPFWFWCGLSAAAPPWQSGLI